MNKRFLAIVLSLIIIIGSFAGCKVTIGGNTSTVVSDVSEVTSNKNTSSQNAESKAPASSEPQKQTAKIILADLGNDVIVHSDLQELFVSGKSSDALKEARGVKALDVPNPVKLSWVDNTGKKADSYTIKISEDKSFKECDKYSSKTAEYSLYNLKIGTVYYWQVTGTYGNETVESDVISFTTENRAPRVIYAPGVINFRDVGGWKTEDGGSVKQGLLYRCAKLNDHNTGKTLITAEGKEVMLGELGIKSEMDLRRKDQTGGLKGSVLGKEANYFLCAMTSDGNILLDNSGAIVEAFKVLGNEKNYPVAFHCSIGTDRTGVIAFLVLNLLGVSKENIYSDYMFSNFANIGSSRNHATPKNYFSIIDSFSGANLAEKTYNYLLSIGCAKADLDNVIKILKQK